MIYQADKENQVYQFNTYLNTTSQDVTAYYPQFMYESIFKTALDEPDFEFTVNTVPFPIFYVFSSRIAQAESFDYCGFIGIALALIPCTMVSYILKEREQQLKHMQVISGMSLKAYWIANILSDILKCYLPMFCFLILSSIFGISVKDVWVIFMIFPWAIVPFSYMTSFLFTSDTVAQIMTLFVHFLFAAVLSFTVFTLQIIP